MSVFFVAVEEGRVNLNDLTHLEGGDWGIVRVRGMEGDPIRVYTTDGEVRPYSGSRWRRFWLRLILGLREVR